MDIVIQTLGCRLNQIESESIAKKFIESNFSVSLENVSASTAMSHDVFLCIVNTCSVTQKADQKARRVIRLLLEKFPSSCVIVTGCYAELSQKTISEISSRVAVLPGLKKSRMAKVPPFLRRWQSQCQSDFRLAIDITDAEKFAKAVSEKIFNAPAVQCTPAVQCAPAVHCTPAVSSATAAPYAPTTQYTPIAEADARSPVVQHSPASPLRVAENSFELSTETFEAHSRASIKIQDGCDFSCAYCAIKNARGKSVSLDAAKVIERVQELEKAGQHEIVFTGVNVALYNSSYNGKKILFADLLELLLAETHEVQFRLSSILPRIVDNHFCDVVADERVCPHFHLSVQSGSDKILSLMRRGYKAVDVALAVKKLRLAKNKITPFLACDIIAGFPGESADDFADTMSLMRDCDFTSVHAFPFSARHGTEAFEMKPKIPQSIAGERVAQLLEFSKAHKIAYINSFRNQTLPAIVETVKTPRKNIADTKQIFHAVTNNFLHCEFQTEFGIAREKNLSSGQRIDLRVVSADIKRIATGHEYDVLSELV